MAPPLGGSDPVCIAEGEASRKRRLARGSGVAYLIPPGPRVTGTCSGFMGRAWYAPWRLPRSVTAEA
jgi:hypothetical protein